MQKDEETKFLESVRNQLKLIRNERGVSQEEVYLELNIHIGRIETSQSNITILTLYKLCKFYNIDIKEFFNRI